MDKATIDFLKIFSLLATLVTPVIQFYTKVQERIRIIQKAQDEVNSFGKSFFWTTTVWLKLFAYIAGLISLASIVALVQGYLINFSNASPWILYIDLWGNAFLILIVYVVIAVSSHYNVIPKILLFITRRAKVRPGIINSKWFLKKGEHFDPMNVHQVNCVTAANGLFEAIRNIEYHKGNEAERPIDVSNAVAANILVFGCTIEQTLTEMRKPLDEWRRLYNALGDIAKTSENPLDPEFINAYDPRTGTYYSVLRKLSGLLPNEAAVDQIVSKTFEILKKRFQGDASSLPEGNIFFSDSLKRADKRAISFPKFKGETMRKQFLKLCIKWELWSGLNPGLFIYPFSPSLSRLLLNTKCIVTSPSCKEITIDGGFRNLVAYCEDLIVKELKKLIENTQDREFMEALESQLACSKDEIKIWQLSLLTDYLLWHLAKNEESAKELFDLESEWEIETNSFKRS